MELKQSDTINRYDNTRGVKTFSGISGAFL